MFKLALCAALAASSAVYGSPTPRAMAVHDQRASIPNTFTLAGGADSEATLDFRIGLTPNNINGLETALYAVSEPDSALYGQHLTLDEVMGIDFCHTSRH